MTLSVIGAGFGRTGTMTLKVALEQLGLGKCHHMEEIFGDPSQLPAWQAVTAGEPADWDAIYKGYDCSADWPGAFFWRELADHYPKAKIILTTRSPESWLESYSKTIMTFMQNMPDGAPPHVIGICDLVKVLVGEKTFGSAFDNKAAAINAFRNHVEEVTESIPAGRLLRYEVMDGWEPLCEFLGKPVPATQFPRTNNTAEFFDNFSVDA